MESQLFCGVIFCICFLQVTHNIPDNCASFHVCTCRNLSKKYSDMWGIAGALSSRKTHRGAAYKHYICPTHFALWAVPRCTGTQGRGGGRNGLDERKKPGVMYRGCKL